VSSPADHSAAALHFIFDAGTTARLYLPDVSSRNLLEIYGRFPGEIHAPSLVLGEITAAWLAGVRAKLLTLAEYDELKSAFLADVSNGRIVIWSDDTLHNAVVEIQEMNSSMLGRQLEIRTWSNSAAHLAVPRIETSDAYYLALARVLQEANPRDRAIVVTNDNAAWTVARSLGMEAFHGRTCDLGIGHTHVGAPGANFPQGRRCIPCQLDGCPSHFRIDFDGAPPNLGSGIPRQQRTHA